MGTCTSDLCDKGEGEGGRKRRKDEEEANGERSEVDKLRSLDLSLIPKAGLNSGKYIGRVLRVYDGDTLTVTLDIGRNGTYKAYQIRLYGCDAPEKKGLTKAAAIEAKNEVLNFIGASGAIDKKQGKQTADWFQQNPTLVTIELMSAELRSVDKYGRELARVSVGGKDLTEHMIGTGHAYPYQGGTKDQSRYEAPETPDP